MKLLALVALLVGCVDTGPGPQPKKVDRKLVAANLLTAVPPEVQHLDVMLGGQVNYVGNTVDRQTLAPGQTMRITHVWQVAMPPGPGWRVFAFVRGAPNTADFMNLEATDMELGHPVDKWKAGEVIADPMDLALRPDWKSRTATLYIGLVRTGGHTTGDRMSAIGPNTLDRAIIAKTFDVDLSKAPPPPGTVYIPRANGPIVLDGVAADPGWIGVQASPEFLTAEGSPEPIGKATARMTWDDEFLYVFVNVTDSDIYSEYKQHDQPLWKADAVELFIDADGNRRGYVELQVNPNNATFDSWFASTRAQPGDEKWDSDMKTAVKVRGTADQAGDTDQGWDVEIEIPYAAVKGRDDAMNVHIPPQVGDRWKLNVVRVDSRTGSKEQSASSWNRITYSDFHALDRMLTVVFADSQGSIVPKAVAPGQGSGAGSAAQLQGSGAGSATHFQSGALLAPPSAGNGSANIPRTVGNGSGAGSAVDLRKLGTPLGRGDLDKRLGPPPTTPPSPIGTTSVAQPDHAAAPTPANGGGRGALRPEGSAAGSASAIRPLPPPPTPRTGSAASVPNRP